MADLPKRENPPIDLGAAALVLGTIGLVLFFLPVLGIPLSGLALLFGLAGFARLVSGGSERLRGAVAGTAISALALGINVAIAYAPAGYITSRPPPPSWQPVPDRPYVPPPARPGMFESAILPQLFGPGAESPEAVSMLLTRFGIAEAIPILPSPLAGEGLGVRGRRL